MLQRNCEKTGLLRCMEVEFLSLPPVALPFPQSALLNSIPRVQLRLITFLGNFGCVAVASFLGVFHELLCNRVVFFLNLRCSIQFHLFNSV
jgi:hypothetical protein